jgi:hypothetical protein
VHPSRGSSRTGPGPDYIDNRLTLSENDTRRINTVIKDGIRLCADTAATPEERSVVRLNSAAFHTHTHALSVFLCPTHTTHTTSRVLLLLPHRRAAADHMLVALDVLEFNLAKIEAMLAMNQEESESYRTLSQQLGRPGVLDSVGAGESWRLTSRGVVSSPERDIASATDDIVHAREELVVAQQVGACFASCCSDRRVAPGALNRDWPLCSNCCTRKNTTWRRGPRLSSQTELPPQSSIAGRLPSAKGELAALPVMFAWGMRCRRIAAVQDELRELSATKARYMAKVRWPTRKRTWAGSHSVASATAATYPCSLSFVCLLLRWLPVGATQGPICAPVLGGKGFASAHGR